MALDAIRERRSGTADAFRRAVATLVTGGAGYIGSHMVQLAMRRGIDVIVIDDLSNGHRHTLPANVPLLVADIADRARVEPFMRTHGVDEILHFASRIQVGESVVDPKLYYRHNLAAAISLLDSALACGVQRFVLSSTAAVYGIPHETPITEAHPTCPINPYGETKLAIERMLAAYERAYGLRWLALRYFNASGAAPDASLGECHEPETHLIPLVLQAASAARAVDVFGRDYPTPDGTCIRDYIHVVDLAEAHLAALVHLRGAGACSAMNLGSGVGHSVEQVIDACRRATGIAIQVKYGARREGDPPSLVASPARAHATLGWRTTRSALETIVGDAWQWHLRQQKKMGRTA